MFTRKEKWSELTRRGGGPRIYPIMNCGGPPPASKLTSLFQSEVCLFVWKSEECLLAGKSVVCFRQSASRCVYPVPFATGSPSTFKKKDLASTASCSLSQVIVGNIPRPTNILFAKDVFLWYSYVGTLFGLHFAAHTLRLRCIPIILLCWDITWTPLCSTNPFTICWSP